MKIPNRIKIFLKNVNTYNANYYYVEIQNQLELIPGPFFDWSEIESSRALQEDWGIHGKYYVFCGDMHDVIALKKSMLNNFSVVYLDEERKESLITKSMNNFERLLFPEDQAINDDPSKAIGGSLPD